MKQKMRFSDYVMVFALIGLFVIAITAPIMLTIDNPEVAQVQTGYYLPVTMIGRDQADVYFESENGNVWVCENQDWFDCNAKYLLHMDSMGTDTIEDDVILTIWQTKQ